MNETDRVNIAINALLDYKELLDNSDMRGGFCPFSYILPIRFDNDSDNQCDLFCYWYFPELKESNICPCRAGRYGEVKIIVNKLLKGESNDIKS